MPYRMEIALGYWTNLNWRTDVELTHRNAPSWLKRQKTSTTVVYQKTGVLDPTDPRSYKSLSSQIKKLTPHTV